MTRVGFVFLTFLYSLASFLDLRAQCNVNLGGYTGGPFANFTTQAQLLAGASATNNVHLSFSLNNSNCTNWTLKVRTTTANFSNGANGVPVQHVALKFNGVTGGPSAGSIGYNSSPVSLSTSDQILVSNAGAGLQSPPYYYFEHLFSTILTGGTHMYQPVNGTFSTTLVFTLFNNLNQQIATYSMALSFQINYQGPNLFDRCQGMSMWGNISSPIASFSSYAELMNGKTTNEALSITYGLVNNSTNCPGWSLKVRASSAYFTNSGNNIPVDKVALQFNNVAGGPSANDIGVSYTPVYLSTTDRVLIDHSNARLTAPPHSNVVHRWNMIIDGGSHMLQPSNGSFTVNLVFTLYDWNDQLVTTWSTNATIQINFNGNNLYTMTLQNGGDVANFSFTDIPKYVNGLSLSKPNGLKITGYQNYQVFAQTTSPELVSGTTSETVPVSIVKLEVSRTPAITGVTCNTITLATSNPTPIITNTNTAYPHQTVEYNLRYFIEPGSFDAAAGIPIGTFTGTLVLACIPY